MSDVEGDEPMEAVAEAVASAGKKKCAILNQNLMKISARVKQLFSLYDAHYVL